MSNINKPSNTPSNTPSSLLTETYTGFNAWISIIGAFFISILCCIFCPGTVIGMILSLCFGVPIQNSSGTTVQFNYQI